MTALTELIGNLSFSLSRAGESLFFTTLILLGFAVFGWRALKRTPAAWFFYCALGVSWGVRLLLALDREMSSRYFLAPTVLLLIGAPAGFRGARQLWEWGTRGRPLPLRWWRTICGILVLLLVLASVIKLSRPDRKDFIQDFAIRLLPYNAPETLLIDESVSADRIRLLGPSRLSSYGAPYYGNNLNYAELLEKLPQFIRQYREIFVLTKDDKAESEPLFRKLLLGVWDFFPFDLVAASQFREHGFRLYRFNGKIGDGVLPLYRWQFPARLDLRTLDEKGVDLKPFLKPAVQELQPFVQLRGLHFYVPSRDGWLFATGTELPAAVNVFEATVWNHLLWPLDSVEIPVELAESEEVPEVPAPPPAVPRTIRNAELEFRLEVPDEWVLPVAGARLFAFAFNPVPCSPCWRSSFVTEAGEQASWLLEPGGKGAPAEAELALSYVPFGRSLRQRVPIRFEPDSAALRHQPRKLLVVSADWRNLQAELEQAVAARGLPWALTELPKVAYENGFADLPRTLAAVTSYLEQEARHFDLILILADATDFNRRRAWENVVAAKEYLSSWPEAFRSLRRAAGTTPIGIVAPFPPVPGSYADFAGYDYFRNGRRYQRLLSALRQGLKPERDHGIRLIELPPLLDPDQDYMRWQHRSGSRYRSAQFLSPGGTKKIAGALIAWAVDFFSGADGVKPDAASAE